MKLCFYPEKVVRPKSDQPDRFLRLCSTSHCSYSPCHTMLQEVAEMFLSAWTTVYPCSYVFHVYSNKHSKLACKVQQFAMLGCWVAPTSYYHLQQQQLWRSLHNSSYWHRHYYWSMLMMMLTTTLLIHLLYQSKVVKS